METFSRTGPGVKQDPPHLVQWKSETIWQGLRQHETLCSQINEACVSHRIASGKKGLMAFFSGCRDKKRTAIGWAVFRCGGRYVSGNRSVWNGMLNLIHAIDLFVLVAGIIVISALEKECLCGGGLGKGGPQLPKILRRIPVKCLNKDGGVFLKRIGSALPIPQPEKACVLARQTP